MSFQEAWDEIYELSAAVIPDVIPAGGKKEKNMILVGRLRCT